jgi:hypothetical protein
LLLQLHHGGSVEALFVAPALAQGFGDPVSHVCGHLDTLDSVGKQPGEFFLTRQCFRTRLGRQCSGSTRTAKILPNLASRALQPP